MAGKTSRGLGGGKDDAAPMLIADEPDMPGNSGPTVVDDAKVAEVLKKLRSLDQPPGPLTGVTEVVLDSGSSEPTRLDSGSIQIDSGPMVEIDPAAPDESMRSSQRTTAVGRSLATPVAGQPITIPAELARGTLFGRSIHLPDVNAPDEEAFDISSGAVNYLDGAPPHSQPFPLADALVVPPPTSMPNNIYDPGTGSYESHPGTQLVPRRSAPFKKMFAFLVPIGVIAGGFYVWKTQGQETSPPAQPAVVEPAKPAAPPPASDPMPPAPAATKPAAAAAPTAAEPTAAEPEPAAPAAAAAPAPAAPHAAAEPEPAPSRKAVAPVDEEPTPEAGTPRSKTRRSWATSKPAGARPSTPAKAAPRAETADEPEAPAAAKPGRGKKRVVDEDPDATMAPSE